MPSFQTQVNHQLGKEQAKTRLMGFMDQVQIQYQGQIGELESSWDDYLLRFSLTTYGFKIDGNLAVDDDSAAITGNLPLAALPFRGRIENSIGQALDSALQDEPSA